MSDIPEGKVDSNLEQLQKKISELQKQVDGKTSNMNPWWHVYVILSSIATALSLLSLFRDFIKIHQFFLDIVNAWTILVRPIADWLFSWPFELLGLSMPGWVGDYLIVGIILSIGRLRAHYYRVSSTNHNLFDPPVSIFVLRTLLCFFIWPIYVVEQTLKVYSGSRYYVVSWSSWFYYLFSPFLYFLIILAANYTFLIVWKV